MKNVRIVIAGPSYSGKSIFAVYLEDALDDIGVNAFHEDYDPFFPTKDCSQKNLQR